MFSIEILDFPMNNGDFPSFFVCLPGRVTTKKTTIFGELSPEAPSLWKPRPSPPCRPRPGRQHSLATATETQTATLNLFFGGEVTESTIKIETF
jgi:hypothetical protein